MQENESIIVAWCELKILSLGLLKVLIIVNAGIFISYSERTSLIWVIVLTLFKNVCYMVAGAIYIY